MEEENKTPNLKAPERVKTNKDLKKAVEFLLEQNENKTKEIITLKARLTKLSNKKAPAKEPKEKKEAKKED